MNLSDPLYAYLLDEMVDEPEVLSRLRAETATLPKGDWQITLEQGRFLAFLVEIIDARRVLEIGTFTGYGTLAMALALPKDGVVVTLEGNPEYPALGRPFWQQSGVESKIELRLGMALDLLSALTVDNPADAFDFIFIDADKKEYGAYFDHAMRLLRPGGVIAIDNMFWKGAVADPADQRNSTKAIRALTRRILRDPGVTTVPVPIGDGLMLARKRRERAVVPD